MTQPLAFLSAADAQPVRGPLFKTI